MPLRSCSSPTVCAQANGLWNKVTRAFFGAGMLALAGTVIGAAPASAQVRISQVYGGGGNVGARYLSDYMEIYNAGAPQSLVGWSIQYSAATGTTWTVTPLPATVLGTGQYFLIKQANGTTLPAGQSMDL